jgi:perosamine synthetase
VLVSAVTHPDMVRIIEGHGLRAGPVVDLQPATLEPQSDLLEKGHSPRTRAVLVAHLFGGRFDQQSMMWYGGGLPSVSAG